MKQRREAINKSRSILLLTIPNPAILAVLAILQSRWLGVEDRGLVVLILTISGSSAVIGSLGYGLARVGEDFSSLNFREFAHRIFVTVTLAIVILILATMSYGLNLNTWIWSFLVVSSLAYLSIFMLTDLLFVSKHAVGIRAISLALISIEFIVNIVVHNLLTLTLHAVFLINVLVAVTGLSFIAFTLRKDIDFSSKRFRSIRKDLPYLITYVGSFLYVYIYRLPASYVIPPAELALITISFSFAFAGMPLIYFMMQNIRSLDFDEGLDFGSLNLKMTSIFFVLVFFATTMYIFSDQLVLKTVGIEFFGSSEQLQRVAFAVPFFAIFMFHLSFLQAITSSPKLWTSGLYIFGSTATILISGAQGGALGICTSVLVLHVLLGVYSGIEIYKLSKKSMLKQVSKK